MPYATNWSLKLDRSIARRASPTHSLNCRDQHPQRRVPQHGICLTAVQGRRRAFHLCQERLNLLIQGMMGGHNLFFLQPACSHGRSGFQALGDLSQHCLNVRVERDQEAQVGHVPTTQHVGEGEEHVQHAPQHQTHRRHILQHRLNECGLF